MGDSHPLLTALVSGMASGVLLVMGLVTWRSALSSQVRYATLAFALSGVAWLITEAPALCAEIGPLHLPLLILAYPVAGFFWLFVLAVVEDRRIKPLMLAPAVVLALSGPLLGLTEPPLGDLVWSARNGLGAVLALHAALVVLRGWRGDLVEGRRRLRAILVGVACLYAVTMIAAGFINRANPEGPWLAITASRAGGGLIVGALALALTLLSLQARPTTLGAARRLEPKVEDPRIKAADRRLVEQLNDLMAEGIWRREGLTIGDLSAALAAPEHRLRRLINQRLSHRNFADFINGYRIEAAKLRLADPSEARTTVAVIAFDLGFGSLGPFNRAFKTATGATPSEWRRDALLASPKLNETV
jgi:AraC-like DNA-binding protein